MKILIDTQCNSYMQPQEQLNFSVEVELHHSNPNNLNMEDEKTYRIELYNNEFGYRR